MSDEAPIVEERGVKFSMIDGETRVVCLVTREALSVLAGRTVTSSEAMLESYRRRVATIETCARRQYEAGSKAPCVHSADLVHLIT